MNCRVLEKQRLFAQHSLSDSRQLMLERSKVTPVLITSAFPKISGDGREKNYTFNFYRGTDGRVV